MIAGIDIETISLKSGIHRSRDEGVCAMELVAWMAGEQHSDHPKCASPVISTFLRDWNDELRSDEERNRLIRPLLPHVIDTAVGPDAEERRAWMATDWLVREYAPAWLELAGLANESAALRSLSEIRDITSANYAHAAWDAVRDAAWDAARAAAGVAAWAAVRAAAWDAAWDAAWAAAGVAAGDAAGVAAGDAAGDATWDALAPTVARLQESAQQLVLRMCEVAS